MGNKTKKFVACLMAMAIAAVSFQPAYAIPIRPVSPVVTIRHDMGGEIINYAIRMRKMEKAGSEVRFAGRCDSACTLFLALPSSKTCVANGASFGFHLPYGAGPSGNRRAADFLMRNYPGWVRGWIRANGGLTSGIKTMPYRYAAKYIKPCDSGQKIRSI